MFSSRCSCAIDITQPSEHTRLSVAILWMFRDILDRRNNSVLPFSRAIMGPAITVGGFFCVMCPWFCVRAGQPNGSFSDEQRWHYSTITVAQNGERYLVSNSYSFPPRVWCLFFALVRKLSSPLCVCVVPGLVCNVRKRVFVMIILSVVDDIHLVALFLCFVCCSCGWQDIFSGRLELKGARSREYSRWCEELQM